MAFERHSDQALVRRVEKACVELVMMEARMRVVEEGVVHALRIAMQATQRAAQRHGGESLGVPVDAADGRPPPR